MSYFGGWRQLRTVYGIGAVVLLALCAIGFAVALLHPRSDRVAIDDVYLIRSESVLFDRDLSIERQDLERFAARRGRQPLTIHDALDGGVVMYSLFAAPFVWLAPERGAAVLNPFLLAVGGWMASPGLFHRLRTRGPPVGGGPRRSL